MQETQVQSLGWKISWRRQWQPTPVFLPGKSHGWRSLVGYSPWGHKELETTERLHFLSFFPYKCMNLRMICNIYKIHFDPVGLCSRLLGYVFNLTLVLPVSLVGKLISADGELKMGVYTRVSNKLRACRRTMRKNGSEERSAYPRKTKGSL